MKKSFGIIRNKSISIQEARQKIRRKKNRFQIAGKQEQCLSEIDREGRGSQQLLTSTSVNSGLVQQSSSQQVYKKAREKLDRVIQIQKQINSQAKARLISFKQSDNAKYDSNIAKLAVQATNNLLQAQRSLKQLKNFQTANDAQKKFIHNMQLSLAQEIREVSRNLRQQQKDYFDRLHMYEKNTANNAIQLTPEERRSMKECVQEMQQTKNDLRNDNIEQLVKSINKLSVIYKQLNQLVIEQGSLIDRIDVNIQATLEHTKQAVVHLQGADEASSSTFADNFIKILVVMILITAVMLGVKYMN